MYVVSLLNENNLKKTRKFNKENNNDYNTIIIDVRCKKTKTFEQLVIIYQIVEFQTDNFINLLIMCKFSLYFIYIECIVFVLKDRLFSFPIKYTFFQYAL